MIQQRNLSLISNKTVKTLGRRIPEEVIERDYCIAWFLVCLAESPLKDKLAFKGGTALRRCHFEDYRFSEDLDFTVVVPTPLDDLKKGFETVFHQIRAQSGITFSLARVEPDSKNTHTLYFSYEGPMPPAGREIKVDITFKETIVAGTERKEVIKTYEEYSDLPTGARVLVYSLEEILTEKIAAISDKARTEPRDVYDLWRIAGAIDIDHEILAAYVVEKIKFKGDEPAARAGNLAAKEKRLEKAWRTRLSHQMSASELPEFSDVYREAKRIFRALKIFEGLPLG